MQQNWLPRRLLSDSMWKRKAKNVALRRDRYILNAIDRVAHWRCYEFLAGVEVPEGSASCRVNRLERLRIITKEHQPAGGCQCSTPRVAAANLRITPYWLSICHRKRQQNFLPVFVRWGLRARIVESLAMRELSGDCEVFVTAFEGHHVEQLRVRIVGRREPVRSTSNPRADVCALCSRDSIGKYWAAGCVDTFRPIQFRDERRCSQK